MIKVQNNTYDSSTVEASSYNYKEQILTVLFNHATYIYYNVDVSTYNNFATATSQGRALNEFIKGKFKFDKVNEDVKVEDI
tara:strand:+ start:1702 stop:1944 length:243 start_codon:yes stop_codon:yes gene_type:complete